MVTIPPDSRLKSSDEDAADKLKLGLLGETLGFRFRRIQDRLSEALRTQLAERHIKSGVYSALALIAANPGISQVDLARVGGFEKTAVVALIDDLEKRGWARRKSNVKDRRRHSLIITPPGSELLADLSCVAKSSETIITDRIELERLRALSDILDEVYALLEQSSPRS